jgi:RNA-directed DNA polymerase
MRDEELHKEFRSARCSATCTCVASCWDGRNSDTKSVLIRICEAISGMTGRDQSQLDQERVVAKLNRMMIGWANYFCLGPVSKAYQAVDQHARNRLLEWLCAKHKLEWPAAARLPESFLHEMLGLVCLSKRANNLPWATS